MKCLTSFEKFSDFLKRFFLYAGIMMVDCVVAYKVTSLLPKVVGVALYRSAPLRYHIGCCFNDT